MTNWEDLKKELLQNKDVAREYKKLESQYSLIAQVIEARIKRGITQKDLAEKMGTKQSAIARLESGNYNPSISFLEKLARVLGYKLTVKIG